MPPGSVAKRAVGLAADLDAPASSLTTRLRDPLARPPVEPDGMCGIAGYSFRPDAEVDRGLVARVLLAGIAERGCDASGACHRTPAARTVEIVKRCGGASRLIRRLDVPAAAGEALLHVRDHTKGHPSLELNNHPIRHGPVVGVHNGTIENDDELLARHGLARHDPRMSVDSEAIFALAARYPRRPHVLEQLTGSIACAWLDERFPARLFLARGLARPLWIAEGPGGLYFASTLEALRLLAEFAGPIAEPRRVPEGTWLEVVRGTIAREARFDPDRSYRAHERPAVRSPHERRACLRLLHAGAGGRPQRVRRHAARSG